MTATNVTVVNTDGVPIPGFGTGGTAASPLNTVAVGDSYAHIAGAATTTVKNSPGTVKAVIVSTKGTVASTVTVKDSATVIAIIDSLNNVGTFALNVACATSIVVVTTATAGLDVTVTYQ